MFLLMRRAMCGSRPTSTTHRKSLQGFGSIIVLVLRIPPVAGKSPIVISRVRTGNIRRPNSLGQSDFPKLNQGRVSRFHFGAAKDTSPFRARCGSQDSTSTAFWSRHTLCRFQATNAGGQHLGSMLSRPKRSKKPFPKEDSDGFSRAKGTSERVEERRRRNTEGSRLNVCFLGRGSQRFPAPLYEK